MRLFSKDGRAVARRVATYVLGSLIAGVIAAVVPGPWLTRLGTALAIAVALGSLALWVRIREVRREPALVFGMAFWWALTLWWLYGLFAH